MIRSFCALALIISLGLPASAQDHDHTHDHSHDHAVDFDTLSGGLEALAVVTQEIREAVDANDMGSLHELSEELHAVADGLGKHADDVAEAARGRFTGVVNQMRALSDRLHTAEEAGDPAAAAQIATQIEAMMPLIRVSAGIS